jgi:hypothetical protein
VVERHLPKVNVAGSSPAARSNHHPPKKGYRLLLERKQPVAFYHTIPITLTRIFFFPQSSRKDGIKVAQFYLPEKFPAKQPLRR